MEKSKKKANLTVYPMTCCPPPQKAYHVPYDMSKKKAKNTKILFKTE